MKVKDFKKILLSFPEEWDDMKIMGEVTEWGDANNGEPIYSVKPYNENGEDRLLLEVSWMHDDITNEEIQDIISNFKVKY